MKLAVVGSRSVGETVEDVDFIYEVLDTYRKFEGLQTIVSGGAKGVDEVAEFYASERKIDLRIFYAKWNQYGKAAGYRRNLEIWDYADEGVAFWDGKSKGTSHSFELAIKHKKTLLVFKDKELVKYFKNGEEHEVERSREFESK